MARSSTLHFRTKLSVHEFTGKDLFRKRLSLRLDAVLQREPEGKETPEEYLLLLEVVESGRVFV